MRKIAGYVFALTVLSFFGFFFISRASAATIFLSPSADSYALGQTFPVQVEISSPDTAVNAVSGDISFPTDVLSVSSVSIHGSVVDFWATQPSADSGKVHFEGVILSPGFQGSAGNIMTVYFKTKASGSAALSFATASALANDGKGTNVLDSTGGAKFTITASDDSPAALLATAEPDAFSVLEVPRNDPTDPIVKLSFEPRSNAILDHYEVSIDGGTTTATTSASFLSPPLLPGLHAFTVKALFADGSTLVSNVNASISPISAPSLIGPGGPIADTDYLLISGTSSPNTTVEADLADQYGDIDRRDAIVDGRGSFTLVWPAHLSDGVYKMSVEAIDARGARSLPTEPIQIFVRPSPAVALGMSFMAYASAAVAGALIIFALIVIIFLLWHALVNINRALAKKRKHAEGVVGASFKTIDADMKAHIEALRSIFRKKASSTHDLNDEEMMFIQKVTQDLARAEAIIDKEIKTLTEKK